METQTRRQRQKWQEDVRLGSISKEELMRFADGLDVRGGMNSRGEDICRIISGRMELLFMGQGRLGKERVGEELPMPLGSLRCVSETLT